MVLTTEQAQDVTRTNHVAWCSRPGWDRLPQDAERVAELTDFGRRRPWAARAWRTTSSRGCGRHGGAAEALPSS
ncbi:hypothetical protein QJS66_00430 [Kocuria rhizophila]|nr:hypothetical protein QJS66_00430 [Kocuria rhizophila]